VLVLAGFTPWLFELGRMAIEASTQPLFVVLLLLTLERATRLERYTIPAGIAAGVLIGLGTYSYTGSRLLGPLFAAALAVFPGPRAAAAGGSCSLRGRRSPRHSSRSASTPFVIPEI